MSKKLRNSILFCLTTSLIVGGSLTLLADTTTTAPTQDTTTQEQSTATTVTAKDSSSAKSTTNAEGYIPPNNKSETIYVNLDNYGVPTETQVVNGYRIDGDSKIVDYGNYSNVTNLTDYTTPTINGDQITWDLDDDVTNFYYQGTLDHIDLPWNFTVRYKLNGVETKAEDLAGAAGMIETIVDVTPNDNVSDYLKNNFFLQLSTSYDMGKCLSVEAPDAVEVSLGATKSLTFMAMPGEETSFHIYVGSDSYESSGFNVVIAPLKMSALDEVKDLKDAKERIEDAFDAASDSLDIILDSTNNIKDGLSELSDGVASIQKSLEAIRKDDGVTDEKVEALLESSTALNESLQKISPHFDTTQECVNELNSTTNSLVTNLKSLQPVIEETKTCIETLQDDCSALSEIIEDINSTGGKLNDNLDLLKKHLDLLAKDMHSLDTALSNMGSGLDSSQSSFYNASNSLSSLNSQLSELSGSISEAQIGALVQSGAITMEQAQALANLRGMSDDLNSLSSVLSHTGSLAGDSTDLITVLRTTSLDIAKLSASLSSVTGNLQTINTSLTNGTETMTTSLSDISTLLGQLNNTLSIGSLMIDDLDNTQTVINKYTPELITFLQDSSSLVTSTGDTTSAATDLGSQLHSTITNNRQHTYDSIDSTLSASIHTFQNIIDSLGQTNDLKKNKDIIKNTIDDEWDRLDDDFNLLDYDSEAGPISLVSDKNTNVDSIQIILRTPEISIDKKAEIEAEEAAQVEVSVWDRIKNIFANIF